MDLIDKLESMNSNDSTKKDYTKGGSLIFKREYTKSQFKHILLSINKIYEKMIYNVLLEKKDQLGIKNIYQIDTGFDINSTNQDETYTFVINIVDLPQKYESEIRDIINASLDHFIKAGMPFMITIDHNKLSLRSKVLFSIK